MQHTEDALMQFREPVALPAASRLAIRLNHPAPMPSAIGTALTETPLKINYVNAAAEN